jgi:hypothetical protein
MALVQFMQFGDQVLPGSGRKWKLRIIKLELGASVGFIHKESVTMHGHTILKLPDNFK